MTRSERVYWRSLGELAETTAGGEIGEFPDGAGSWPPGLSRRRFLTLMSASLAFGGVTGCTRPPEETIVPYVRQPEGLAADRPLFFATAMSLGGYATGLLVESHAGRPTKVEGNPDHPASLGATDLFAQASVLTLYDPDRSQAVTRRGAVTGYDQFITEFRRALAARPRGRGVRILTPTGTSPTLVGQLHAVLRAFPDAGWHQWEPLGPSAGARDGALLAFGQDVAARYHLERADRVLALDADFLACEPRSLRYVADFAARRAPRPEREMNRLYVVEPTPTVTGSVADHRWPVRASEIGDLAGALAARLGVDPGTTPAVLPPDGARWIDAVGRDLEAHRGRSLVIAGDTQPGVVHALAHAMNRHLGNVGATVVYTEPVAARPVDQLDSLRQLAEDLRAGRVEVLLILGGNPAYTAPADLDVPGALRRARFAAHLSLYADETSSLCEWHVPEAHFLESWSDARAFDGTASIVQPLVAPLYDGRSAHEVLAAFTDVPFARGHDLIRAHWREQHRGPDFEAFWREALHRGVVPGTATPPRDVTLRPDLARALARAAPARGPDRGLEIVFRGDPTVHDGTFANNGWLQELPKPLTKLAWDNAALVAPGTADRLGVRNEDVVELTYRGRTLRAPVWVAPGHAESSVTLHLGGGRRRAGTVGSGVGVDAYAVRTSTAPWFDTGLAVRRTGERWPLATTQAHHRMHGRQPVIDSTFERYRRDPDVVPARHDRAAPPPSLDPDVRYPGHAWGMVIDLATCTGCNTCVVACYAENNIPVVGKEQVRMGREMAWLRVDTYYRGDPAHPETFHQPVPCMHCEKAPCEPVCPVMATTHSDEGLNDMVYNRCIGTRYCSNNCPYKVRRFNFLTYADWQTPTLKLLRNPDVSVRSRGVMEKCTYCVQRINEARVAAATEGRRLADGEILTACQAACPTHAITFGDLNDPRSRVHRLRGDRRNYALLAELGTRPRTTYLAAIRHPNPELPT